MPLILQKKNPKETIVQVAQRIAQCLSFASLGIPGPSHLRSHLRAMSLAGFDLGPRFQMGVPQNWWYHFGVPIIRNMVFWGLY